MPMPEVKTGPWIQEGFDLYKPHWGMLVLAGLIAVVITVVTLGILGGPMGAGMAMIVLALKDGKSPTPKAGDVFQGFSYFVPSLLYCILWMAVSVLGSMVLGSVPLLGMLLSFVWGWVLHAFLMFGLYLIVDQEKDFWTAMMASVQKVMENPLPFIIFGSLAGIIGSLGAVLCGIGVVLTYPIQACIVGVAYRDVFTPGQPVQSQTYPPPPPRPDPPQAVKPPEAAPQTPPPPPPPPSQGEPPQEG